MIRKYAALVALSAIVGPAPAHASVVISTAATQNMNCSGGVCAPIASNAVLNVTDLENLLASGNVDVTTTGPGVQAKDIVVKATTSWLSTSTLALDAYRSITVDQPVSVQGLTGLTLTTNDGGKDGELSFGQKGNITFASLSSSLAINGTTYTLENTVQGLSNAIAANPSGAYALASNYDAAQDGTYGASPIFDFYGILEGLGHSISHLKFGEAAVGFVAGLGTGSQIRNFVLSDIEARATSGFAGLAYTINGGSIAHCGVSGSIIEKTNKSEDIGGLVSGNSGTIFDSWASMAITAQRGDLAAGLVAINDGLVERSFATGSVVVRTKRTKGLETLGGLVAANNPGGMIVDSYAEISLTGIGTQEYTWTGGLAGNNQGDISNSYSTGAISNVGGYVGGLIGYDESASGSLSDTYWDTDTSGITNLSQGAGAPPNDPGITGLSTVQFQSGLPSGFDPKVWAEKSTINNGFPYLIANPPPK